MARTLIGTIIAVDTVAVVISPRAICHPVQDIALFEAVLECSGDVNDGHPEHRDGHNHMCSVSVGTSRVPPSAVSTVGNSRSLAHVSILGLI